MLENAQGMRRGLRLENIDWQRSVVLEICPRHLSGGAHFFARHQGRLKRWHRCTGLKVLICFHLFSMAMEGAISFGEGVDSACQCGCLRILDGASSCSGLC